MLEKLKSPFYQQKNIQEKKSHLIIIKQLTTNYAEIMTRYIVSTSTKYF